MTILGIDPGTTRVGYGLIETGRELRHLAHGTLLPNETVKDYSELAIKNAESLDNIIEKYRPGLVGIEKLFFAKNVKTGMAVAQMRGALMLEIAKNGIPIEEYSPSEIKNSVTSYGLAGKKEVAKMVAIILRLKSLSGLDDASDALAVAITAALRMPPNSSK